MIGTLLYMMSPGLCGIPQIPNQKEQGIKEIHNQNARILAGTPNSERPEKVEYQSTRFAMTGVRIVNPDGFVIDSGTIVINNGVIEAVGPSAAPSGIEVVKTEPGTTVYPGFIDAFIGRGVKTPPAAPDTGKPNQNITAPSSVWIGNRKGISPEWKANGNFDWKPGSSDFENGFTAGYFSPMLGMMRGVGVISQFLPDSEKSRILVPEFGSSFSFRNGTGSDYPSNILGQIALMRQVLSDAQSVQSGATLYEGESKPFWMASLEALGPVLKKEQTVLFEANLDREIERTIRLQDEFGFKMALVGGRDAYKVGSVLKQKSIPVILTADLGTEPSTATPEGDPVPKAVKEARLETWKAQVGTAKTLASLGVDFAFTQQTAGGDFWKNIRLMGLNETQVVNALTRTPARILKIDDRLGSLTTGKVANFVVTNGNLMDSNTKILAVYVAGTKQLGSSKVPGASL